MTDFKLENKVILITGASSGIGAATAMNCSRHGAKLVITGRNEDRLKKTYNSLSNGEHLMLTGDLTNQDFIEELSESSPSVDGVVHCAGMVSPYPVKYINEKKIREMMGLNFETAVHIISSLLQRKRINSDASLVWMSSVSANFPHKGGALYASSKAALTAYSKTLAVELASKNIRSNVIEAAMVRTPIFEQAEKEVTPEIMEKHGKEYPLGFGESQDIANAAVFLLSPASRWITGTALVMDGGLTAGQ